MHNWSQDLSALLSVNGVISLFTLSILEVVLGIDNIIFISITADKLPRENQKKARTIGLMLALVVRCILLFSISYIAAMKDPVFSLGIYGVSGRGIILFGGGIFLLYKTWQEIMEKIHSDEDEIGPSKKGKSTFNAVVMQIVIIDIIFSFDSILTAVGLSGNVLIMISAVIIAMILMILFSGVVSDFINRNPGIKTIALAFLLVIGAMLMGEAVLDSYNPTVSEEHRIEINKNYAYIALAFAIMVELFNMKERKVKRERDFSADEKKENPNWSNEE
ncbi:MAG: TerC family protein [Bacteroidetes bacterium]|nr:TerC family protein [Bacteroidota bacterium]